MEETNINIFSNLAVFVKGVTHTDDMLQDLPEIAFWGRSNVGKSSLINAILNRKKLVKVSNTPGKTKEINYFALTNGGANTIYLVDLPGYGYARITKSIANAWSVLIEQYIKKSVQLKRIYLLIDSRIGFKELDLQVMEFLNYNGKSYQIVFTKIDKINKTELAIVLSQFTNLLSDNPAAYPECISVSSKNKVGIIDLKKAIITSSFL